MNYLMRGTGKAIVKCVFIGTDLSLTRKGGIKNKPIIISLHSHIIHRMFYTASPVSLPPSLKDSSAIRRVPHILQRRPQPATWKDILYQHNANQNFFSTGSIELINIYHRISNQNMFLIQIT